MTDTKRIDPKVPISKWRASSCGEAIWAASNGDVRTLERLPVNKEIFKEVIMILEHHCI